MNGAAITPETAKAMSRIAGSLNSPPVIRPHNDPSAEPPSSATHPKPVDCTARNGAALSAPAPSHPVTTKASAFRATTMITRMLCSTYASCLPCTQRKHRERSPRRGSEKVGLGSDDEDAMRTTTGPPPPPSDA